MNKNIKKWQDYKFGMFIHWGLYSVNGVGCWHMFSDQVDKDEYRARYMPKFTCENYDPNEWAEVAKKAGMKYAVLTARHHDGFCLFDSKYSYEDYTSMNAPCKRDLIKEYCDAYRAKGLAVGLYYSPTDWRFPGYFMPLLYKKNALAMREQCHKQVDELTKNYGKVDILWYDAGEDWYLCQGHFPTQDFQRPADFKTNPMWKGFWQEEVLDKIVRTNQPDIIYNERVGMKVLGDFRNAECKIGVFDTTHPWETCDKLTEYWDWKPNAQPRSLKYLINLLVNVVTGGGNLLLSVGPDQTGKLEPSHVKRLLEIGEFMDKYGDSIYETEAGPIVNGKWGGATYKDNRVFLHVLDWKLDYAMLPILGGKVTKVRALNSDSASYEIKDGILYATVDNDAKKDYDTIFEVTFDRPVKEIYAGYDPHSFVVDEQGVKDVTINVDKL